MTDVIVVEAGVAERNVDVQRSMALVLEQHALVNVGCFLKVTAAKVNGGEAELALDVGGADGGAACKYALLVACRVCAVHPHAVRQRAFWLRGRNIGGDLVRAEVEVADGGIETVWGANFCLGGQRLVQLKSTTVLAGMKQAVGEPKMVLRGLPRGPLYLQQGEGTEEVAAADELGQRRCPLDGIISRLLSAKFSLYCAVWRAAGSAV